jgi:hypothetical protein
VKEVSFDLELIDRMQALNCDLLESTLMFTIFRFNWRHFLLKEGKKTVSSEDGIFY